MLVLALQFSKNTPKPHGNHHPPKTQGRRLSTTCNHQRTHTSKGEQVMVGCRRRRTPSKRKRRQEHTHPGNPRGKPTIRNPTCDCSDSAPTRSDSNRPTQRWTTINELTLLRKEVIQPHLPVRLPCYDFTPITDPTFDGSSPKGLGHRLRVLPTFVV